jgi:hypothetical protein
MNRLIPHKVSFKYAETNRLFLNFNFTKSPMQVGAVSIITHPFASATPGQNCVWADVELRCTIILEVHNDTLIAVIFLCNIQSI